MGTFLPALIANVNLCKSRKSVLLKGGNEAVEFRITNCNLYLYLLSRYLRRANCLDAFLLF